MNEKRSGATLLIIFYILDLDGETENYFSPGYISTQYNKLLGQHPEGEMIKNIMNDRKKHGDKNASKTLEKEVE